ncbi:MAG: MBL fold metallo-hydrolase [Thermotogota bacterium]|nr:MBL fold metallo-hydrolase [Thermotogota bacterium]
MTITVLCNDKSLEGFREEHGISFLIDTGNRNYLFDTGTTDVAIENARKLGNNLKIIDSIIISHGHYDHLGGLANFLKLTGKRRVYIGTGALNKKLSGERSVSPNETEKEYIALGAEFVTVEKNTKIDDGIFVISAAPFVTDERPQKKYKHIINNRRETDEFKDELTLLIIKGGKGTVITGCSHRGIVNILFEASRHCEIENVLGGLHLLHKTKRELKVICDKLEEFNVANYFIGHCTGDEAIENMQQRLSANVKEIRAGEIIRL